jgi:hypothetical protein
MSLIHTIVRPNAIPSAHGGTALTSRTAVQPGTYSFGSGTIRIIGDMRFFVLYTAKNGVRVLMAAKPAKPLPNPHILSPFFCSSTPGVLLTFILTAKENLYCDLHHTTKK